MSCIIPNVQFDKDGYPRVKFNKRLWRMNRLMWTFVNGDVPSGMVVAHTCNNKSCINTNHMYLCTAEENSSHAARDNLYRSGDNHPKMLRTDAQCEVMWDMYNTEGMSQEAIGKIYNISQVRVSECIRRVNKKRN